MGVIEFENAEVVAPGPTGDTVILAPLNVQLTERRIGIIGANGSGKSTLARLVNGLIEPTRGHVRVDGFDTRKQGAHVRRRVGFMFTNPAAQLVMPTVAEDISLSLRRIYKKKPEREAAVRRVLERFELTELADSSVHTLSGGQRQLVALATVLATDPDIVVADEPTTLLDLRNSRTVAEMLFGLDQQLILVTHDLELVLRCDRVLVVETAQVVFDGDPVVAVGHYRSLV